VRVLKHISSRFRHAALQSGVAVLALALLTITCERLHLNLATCSLLYVILIVILSRNGSLASSLVASITAAVSLTYLASPPKSFRVDDPFDIVAIIAFLVTSLMIAGLVSELRRLAEEALSSVNRKLIDAEERERNRIARDLHDDVGQRLAVLATELEGVQKDVPSSASELSTSIAAMQGEISAISSDVHAISHELHSSKLEYLGIEAAMRGFCRELAEQRKVKIDFQSKDLTTPLSPEISISLFRVLQEALHNSARHSGASHFRVELLGTSEGINLSVHDSGRGFDPKAAMSGQGLGLTSMKERIKLVRGKFLINSQPDRGTTIQVWVPLSHQHSEDYAQSKAS
jgi:signal transduction histidine kinase